MERDHRQRHRSEASYRSGCHALDVRKASAPGAAPCTTAYPCSPTLNESGQTVGRTSASNAERMAAALERRNGPLKILAE